MIILFEHISLNICSHIVFNNATHQPAWYLILALQAFDDSKCFSDGIFGVLNNLLVLSCITLFRNSSTILKAPLEVSARNVSSTEHLSYKNFVSFCANKRRHSLLNFSNAFFPKDETLQGGIDSFCETIYNQGWLDHRDIQWSVVNILMRTVISGRIT